DKEGQRLREQYEKELDAAIYRIKDSTSKAVQKVPEKAHTIARALAEVGQLYGGLDLFEVRERTETDGGRASTLIAVSDHMLIGDNFTQPAELRRLATLHYHRRGPVGVVLERFNWFPGPANTYRADARLPASLVMLGAGDLTLSPMPLGLLV